MAEIKIPYKIYFAEKYNDGVMNDSISKNKDLTMVFVTIPNIGKL